MNERKLSCSSINQNSRNRTVVPVHNIIPKPNCHESSLRERVTVKRGVEFIGVTMILHTWDQRLRDHIHIHCAIPSFALRAAEGKPALMGNRVKENFLFPVKALSKLFRGKFLAGLRQQYSRGNVIWSQPEFRDLVRGLYKKAWVVYAKPAFKGPHSVLDYIGRYTHRVAISNDRILSIKNNQVTFSYRDRQDCNRKKEMTLSSDEFIRRFLLHTLPRKFMKIRHCGFLSNKSKKKDLKNCREILGDTGIPEEKKTTRALIKEMTGHEMDQCPQCKEGTMVVIAEIEKEKWDTS